MLNQLLHVRNVSKVFQAGGAFRKRAVHAVSDVSFSIAPGEVLGVVGESGSGKSTLARMIANLMEPTSGEIALNGSSVGALKPKRALAKHIQMVLQDPFGALNPFYSVRSIVERPLHVHGISKASDGGEAANLLKLVGLTPAEEFLEKLPHELSGGQRQRVIIAKVLGLRPQLLILDEPTSMLDVSIGLDVMNLLLQIKDERQLSYIFITHNLANAFYMSDRIAVMYAGQIVELGPAEQVVNEPKHPYTKLLLASSPDPWRSSEMSPGIEADIEQQDTRNQPGCRFSHRCPLATEHCRELPVVPMYDVVDGRTVRCVQFEG